MLATSDFVHWNFPSANDIRLSWLLLHIFKHMSKQKTAFSEQQLREHLHRILLASSLSQAVVESFVRWKFICGKIPFQKYQRYVITGTNETHALEGRNEQQRLGSGGLCACARNAIAKRVDAVLVVWWLRAVCLGAGESVTLCVAKPHIIMRECALCAIT